MIRRLIIAGAMNILVTLLLWIVLKTIEESKDFEARITLAAPLATLGRE